MNAPAFITFTGVDNATDVGRLIQLDDDYPGLIEWGFLFSTKRQGVEKRYPSIATVEWFVQEIDLRCSAHLCGADAREVIESGASKHDLLMPFFKRVQVNTADPSVRPSLIGNWAASRNVRAILQSRRADYFPQVASVDVLFDRSGGQGILPSDWPHAVNSTFCGYAGGLRPENVREAMSTIGMHAHRYWIDMETGVRDADDNFSLDLCRAVCEQVFGAPRSVGA